MSQFINERKKELLMYMVDEIIPSSFYVDQDYDESLEFVIDAFIKKPTLLISFFSLRTLNFIKSKLSGKSDSSIGDKSMFLLEDYASLLYLGIIDYDTLDINVKYTEVLHEMLKMGDLETIVYKNTLLKGLIDLYGYIEIETLKKIYLYTVESSVDPDEFSITKMIEQSGLLLPFVYINDTAIFRRELQEKIGPFLELRTASNKSLRAYKLFSSKEILYFQSRFTFLKKTDFYKNPDCVNLFLNKDFFIAEDPTIFIKDHRVSKESKEIINAFNKTNPKWYLLGRTLDEHKEFITKEAEYDD